MPKLHGQLILNASADPHGIVHVRSLLELASSEKDWSSIWIFVVFRSCHPADVVLVVKFLPRSCHIRADELHTIIIDENVGCTTLHLVCRNGSLDRAYRWYYDGFEAFFVDFEGSADDVSLKFQAHTWHLDGNVRKTVGMVAIESLRTDARVELAVLVHLFDWSHHLNDTARQGLEEE